MKTEDLIGLLAEDAPVRWRLPGRLAAAVLAGTVVAVLLFVGLLGIRPDIVLAGQTARFLFKLLFVVALLCCALGAVAQAGLPQARLGGWGLALIVLLGALAAAVAGELLLTPEHLWRTRLIGQNAALCLIAIPTLALAPLAFLLFALKEGAPSRPGLSGAIAGLAAGGIAATLYAVHCPDDSPLFVATWYLLAIAMVAGAGYVAGSRLLRW
ncbi:NrsF family protein [Xanthobacter autotrophicus]|uniref:NrsF family protein n=1 Tax=Xanthobacter autotrophicus TaxID=280 RepID=UPI00372CC8B1